jgi:hypothetical protein
MKKTLTAIAFAGMLTLASGNLWAQTASAPNVCPNCPTGGVPKKDGTGPGARQGQKQGQSQGPGMRGQRTGPRDGSGPIHTPQGQGKRRGRR